MVPFDPQHGSDVGHGGRQHGERAGGQPSEPAYGQPFPPGVLHDLLGVLFARQIGLAGDHLHRHSPTLLRVGHNPLQQLFDLVRHEVVHSNHTVAGGGSGVEWTEWEAGVKARRHGVMDVYCGEEASVSTAFFYLRAYVPPCLRAYVPPCLRAFVPPCLRAFVPTCLRAYVPPCLRAFVPPCLRAFVPPCLRAFVPSCLRAYVPSCLPAPNRSPISRTSVAKPGAVSSDRPG